ncbi:MAG: hypothetical protein AB8G05_20620 [Oligoflexales bacterium]
MNKTPTCVTNWSWAYLYVLPVFGPWVKRCEIQGVAVSRLKEKEKLNKSLESRATQPAQSASPVTIHINNNQHNDKNN